MRFIAACVAFFLLCQSPAFAEKIKSPQPIRVIINDWTSQIILARVVGSVFSSMGYKVHYPFSTTNDQWGSLGRGIDHVQVEVWQGTMSKMFDRMVATGRIIDAGSHEAKTREDWWYPLYVEKVCPGLPDWRALKKCAALFSMDKGGNAGRYIAGPWEKPESARIRALGLDFKIDAVTQADDLWKALETAKANNQPIVLFNWTPNWVEAVYEGRFVEFPSYDPKCETDPQWGVNPEYLYDCGNPKDGWLKKAAWSGMPAQWSCAFETLQLINFDNKTIATVAAWVDFDKMSHQDAAKRWLGENKSTWQQWIPPACISSSMEE
jgi:glycine betaine/proline transport system substrate-binding protein